MLVNPNLKNQRNKAQMKQKMRRQLFRFHLGNRLQCKGAKNDKSQNWQTRADKNNLINELERVIKSWLVDQTKSTPKQNR